MQISLMVGAYASLYMSSMLIYLRVGTIPTSFGSLKLLNVLTFSANKLSGKKNDRINA